ncbi:MAG: patatin-like phospholipase family protein, partial [Oscillospiraceae bacterium]
MSFGLALAGGGCRGAAHVGVLLALEEAGLRPASISGASAGAIVAGLYACGMSPAAMRERIVTLSPRGGWLLDVDLSGLLRAVGELLTRRPVSLSGLLRGERLRRVLAAYTADGRMADARLPLFIPAVDLTSGETIAFHSTARVPRPIKGVRWVRDAALADAIHASSAVPAVFAPVLLGDCCLVDGGVANVLPVDLLLAYGERIT